MLKSLFISKVRIRILEKYLLDPKPAYHVRGLVRELGEEINAVRRELLNLKKNGILKSNKDGNKLMYRLDQTCAIIPDLRAMFFKDSPIGVKLINRLSTIEGIQLAFVTEAFLNKKYESDIDIDMLIIGNMKIKELNTAISALEKEVGRVVKFAALKPEDYEFARKKKDPILMNTLEKDRIVIVGKYPDLI
jgi:DNA-binding transcriptional ArsR family regulator